jgi:hypothetical protein
VAYLFVKLHFEVIWFLADIPFFALILAYLLLEIEIATNKETKYDYIDENASGVLTESALTAKHMFQHNLLFYK